MSDIDNDLQAILVQKAEAAPKDPAYAQYAPLSPEAAQNVETEAELEKLYGDRPLEAAAGSAASAASLGLSDVALRGLGVPAERLSEVRERSPVASGLGTAAGVVAPIIASGGSSVAAQAAKYAPINLAAKAGTAVEEFAAQALKSKVRSKAAKEILSKATGMAAEGALINEGNLVDEKALGRADLTAENIIASGGAGALLGAGFGTVLGTAQASIPLAGKKLAPLADKLKNHLDDFTDPARSMQEISGMTAKTARSLLRKDPEFFEKAVTYTNTELDHGILTSPKGMYESNQTAMARNGTKISRAIEELHDAATGHPELSLSRDEIYGIRLRDNVLGELRAELGTTSEVSAEKLRTIDKYDELLERYRNKKAPMDLAELDLLRRDLQKIKYKFNGTEAHNAKAEVADALRGGIRELIDETATRVGESARKAAAIAKAEGRPISPQQFGLVDIADRLTTANKNFHMGSALEPGLYWRMTRGGNNLKFMDIIEGAAAQSIIGPTGLVLTGAKKILSSDLRRNFMILTDIQRQANATKELVKSSVSAFISKARRPTSSASLKALVGSGYAMSAKNEAPKNRNEAFQNITRNLTELQTSPDLMQTRLVKSTARISNAAPAVAQEMQQTLVKATQFLATKLPKPVDSGSGEMFKRDFQPTSMEMAKFERYVQAIEHPLTVLDDLEKGTLTAEHVEALKAIYPGLYGQIQQQVLDEIASPAGQALSYSKKVTLGILLDIPTDESLQPQSILALQSNFLPPTDESSKPGGKPVNTAGMGMANRAQTGTERVATRKG